MAAPRRGPFLLAAAVAALVVAGLALAVTSGLLSSEAKQEVSDVALPPLAGFLAIAAARAARRTRDERRRLAWWLLSAAGACWMLGELAWYQDRYLYRIATDPSWADVCFLAGVLPAAGSLLAFAGSRRRSERACYLLGALVVGGSIVFVSKALALSVIFPAGDAATPAARAVYLAYPVTDSVLATLAFIVLMEVPPGRRASLALIAVGILGYAVADTWYSYGATLGRYAPGGISDLGWAAGYLLMGLAALAPEPTRRAPLPVEPPQQDPTSPSSLAVYVPVSIAVVVAAVRPQPPDDPVLLVSGALVLVLFGVRQVLLARENVRLGRNLQARVAELEHQTVDLRVLAEETERVVTSVVDGVLEIGSDGRVRFANPAAARLLGCPATALLGVKGSVLFPDDGAASAGGASVVAQALQTGAELPSTEATCRRADGSIFPAELAVGPVVDHGQVLGGVVVFRDVAQQDPSRDDGRGRRGAFSSGEPARGT